MDAEVIRIISNGKSMASSPNARPSLSSSPVNYSRNRTVTFSPCRMAVGPFLASSAGWNGRSSSSSTQHEEQDATS